MGEPEKQTPQRTLSTLGTLPFLLVLCSHEFRRSQLINNTNSCGWPQAGYREVMTGDLPESELQAGFYEGFARGLTDGYQWGRLRGLVKYACALVR